MEGDFFMAVLNISTNISLPYTLVSNDFIDKYMLTSNSTYSIVYIYLLRMCAEKDFLPQTSFVAEKLNILESDVLNAIKFWAEKKILQFELIGDDISLIFLDIPKEEKTQERVVEKEKHKNAKARPLKSKPAYTNEEIELYKSQPEAMRIFNYAEKILGKLLKTNELTILFSFYDWLRLPVEVIEKLLDYCASIGKKHFNYIEAVAIDWADKGIDSADRVDEYTERFKNNYLKILKFFGITDRVPIDKEIAFMDRWTDDYKMSLEMIKEACSITIMNTSSASFSYADTILKNWKDQNINTVKDAENSKKEFKETKKKNENSVAGKKQNKKNKTGNNGNKVINYTGREWDFDKIEELERELLKK